MSGPIARIRLPLPLLCSEKSVTDGQTCSLKHPFRCLRRLKTGDLDMRLTWFQWCFVFYQPSFLVTFLVILGGFDWARGIQSRSALSLVPGPQIILSSGGHLKKYPTLGGCLGPEPGAFSRSPECFVPLGGGRYPPPLFPF